MTKSAIAHWLLTKLPTTLPSVAITLAVATPIIFLANGPSHFACERLETNYVLCQQSRTGVLGLFPKRKRPFQLRASTVEAIQHIRRDDEGTIVEIYNTHSLFLIAQPNERIFFQDYGRSASKAEGERTRINTYIKGEGDPELRYTNYSFWTLFFNMLWVAVGIAAGVFASRKIRALLNSRGQ